MASEKSQRRWSAKVTETSDALDLEDEIFKSRSARRIALSLKHSAEHSHRRNGAIAILTRIYRGPYNFANPLTKPCRATPLSFGGTARWNLHSVDAVVRPVLAEARIADTLKTWHPLRRAAKVAHSDDGGVAAHCVRFDRCLPTAHCSTGSRTGCQPRWNPGRTQKIGRNHQ
jgi:hypothetical protein